MEYQRKQEVVLVTGGTGFVGIHVILQLLQQGYYVRTTLRSMNRKREVLDMLQTGGIMGAHELETGPEPRLEFIGADLTSDTNWNTAMQGCTYALHVASPITLKLPKDEDEMIRPAVDGALRVLKAARDAGVKRVVMTSNFGAVGYSQKDTTRTITEEDWTDPTEKGLSAYNKSKVLAERAAWDFIKREGGDLELAVVNPVGIFGPSLGPDLSSGFELLRNLLDGTMKAIPKLTLGIVDVRDVADLHIRAMTNPAARGQRFLALAGGTLSLPEIANFVREAKPEAAKHTSTLTMPDWVVRLVGLFNAQARAVAPMLGVNRNASNEKAKNVLGWQPRSKEDAILASVESLLKHNALK